MKTNKAILHFSRFEFKYVLSEASRTELESELGYFMELDPFVSPLRRQKYFVRSLYFDDDSLTNYYEKIDGVMSRRKYRVRTYTDDRTGDCALFLEVKGRYNALVYKHRVELPQSFKNSLEQGREEFLSRLIGADFAREPVVESFIFDSLRMRLKPIVLIDYDRRPYISKYAPDFRITFDDTLSASLSSTLFPAPTDRERVFLPGSSIIEVKFSRQIPAWFHRLIQSYELRRISVSKYCQGAERIELVDNLE